MQEQDIGDEFPPLRVTLTNEQVREYAIAANMPGGRFLSEEQAKAEGLPGQIVPGNMSMAFFSRLLTDAIDGVRIKRLNATFRALVRPNVPLVISGVVTDRDGDTAECDLLLETEDGDRLVTGTATIVLAP
jgi:acyl dehydratase